ncbi:hypothetical protein M885DRAFT_535686 [Pelagophyceae sp. CCMP2097]|nr:hypothetical protein M885DRAFT_535686 [Pelagophyceae sp. CCMP2097]
MMVAAGAAALMVLRPKRTGISAPIRTSASPPVADWLAVGMRIWAYHEDSEKLYEALVVAVDRQNNILVVNYPGDAGNSIEALDAWAAALCLPWEDDGPDKAGELRRADGADDDGADDDRAPSAVRAAPAHAAYDAGSAPSSLSVVSYVAPAPTGHPQELPPQSAGRGPASGFQGLAAAIPARRISLPSAERRNAAEWPVLKELLPEGLHVDKAEFERVIVREFEKHGFPPHLVDSATGTRKQLSIANVVALGCKVPYINALVQANIGLFEETIGKWWPLLAEVVSTLLKKTLEKFIKALRDAAYGKGHGSGCDFLVDPDGFTQGGQGRLNQNPAVCLAARRIFDERIDPHGAPHLFEFSQCISFSRPTKLGKNSPPSSMPLMVEALAYYNLLNDFAGADKRHDEPGRKKRNSGGVIWFTGAYGTMVNAVAALRLRIKARRTAAAEEAARAAAVDAAANSTDIGSTSITAGGFLGHFVVESFDS